MPEERFEAGSGIGDQAEHVKQLAIIGAKRKQVTNEVVQLWSASKKSGLNLPSPIELKGVQPAPDAGGDQVGAAPAADQGGAPAAAGAPADSGVDQVYKEGDVVQNAKGEKLTLKGNQWVPVQ